MALTITLALLAFNLRPAIAAVAPVLTDIERSTGLSAAGAGLLTTLPVLAFGACAPLAPALGRRAGIEVALVGAVALGAAGIALRSVPGIGALFAGTVLLGVGIAVANVLVPALIKRDFPTKPREATAVYSVALSAGAAVAAGVTVPLSHATGGWRWGLGLWALPVVAVVALGLWVFNLRDAHHDIAPVHVSARLWRDRLAWQVTGFMGLQSVGFYVMITWLPSIFERHGVAPAAAGWLLALAGFSSLPAAAVAPVLGSSPKRQRIGVVTVALTNLTAVIGLIVWPAAGAVAWMVLLGIAQGAAISLALTFIVVRAPDSRRAAELSAMAQTVGYLVAGLGPTALGALRDATGGWTAPLLVLAAVLAPELVCGVGSARPRLVGDGRPPAARVGPGPPP